MSNRDRIEHLRAEADAAAKEKAAAKADKAPRPASPRAAASKAKATASTRGRVRIVWNVCDPSGKEVKQFPYAQEQDAIAAARQLTETTGRTHFVTKAEVPFA